MGEHMPKPDLQQVSDAERANVANELEFAERIVRKAQLPYQGDDGSYYLHMREDIIPSGGTEDDVRTLGRPEFDEDAYLLLTPQGDFPVALTRDHSNFAPDRRVDQFRRYAQDIERGTMAGTHSATAMRFIEQKDDASPTRVEIKVTRSTDTPGVMPRTTVELRYVRQIGYDDSMMIQTRHIELDPQNEELYVGDSLDRLQWDGSHIPPGQEGEMRLIPDPLPEMSGATLQKRYNPATPVDRTLTSFEWQELMLGGPTRQDMIQPFRQGERAPEPVPYEYTSPRTQ